VNRRGLPKSELVKDRAAGISNAGSLSFKGRKTPES
jgi:hypothetical protein